jgi:hypothetical protein
MAAVTEGVALDVPGAGLPLSNSACVIKPCLTTRDEVVCNILS